MGQNKKRDPLELILNYNNTVKNDRLQNSTALARALTRTAYEDLGPVRTDTGGDTWFKKGSDDVSKAILGSVGDAGTNIAAGGLSVGERLLDGLLALSPAMETGYRLQNSPLYTANFDIKDLRQKQQNAAALIQKDLYDEQAIAKRLISDPMRTRWGVDTEADSVFGTKSDNVFQSLGDVAARSLTGPYSMGASFLGVLGSETENALNNGGAPFDEALASGLISAGGEVLTEKISGGIKLFGGKTLDEEAAKLISRTLTNKAARTLAKLGLDMAGEGAEEVLSDVISAIGQKLTYADEAEWNELLTTEGLWDSFIAGSAMGLISGGGKAVKDSVTGKDYASGLTNKEKAAVDKAYQDQLAEARKNGNVTEKQKRNLYDEVLHRLDNGGLSAYEDLGPVREDVTGKDVTLEAPVAENAAATVSNGQAVEGPVREDVKNTMDNPGAAVYNNSRSQQVQNVIDRLNAGTETVRLDEIMTTPEIAAAEEANNAAETVNLPNREGIREAGYQKAMQRGSWDGKNYAGPIKQERRMDIVIGLPGSGKSSVYTERLSQEHQSRVIDTDDFREYIPEYNGANAGVVHKESSLIRDMVFDQALDNGDNILLSTIGADQTSLENKIKAYKEDGYSVYLHLNELPNNKSMARAIGRYLQEDGTTGRYVSPGLIASYGNKPTETYRYLTGKGVADDGGLGEDLQGSGRNGDGNVGAQSAETEGQAGSGSHAERLLAGYDWYNNDVEYGSPPRLIESSESGSNAQKAAGEAEQYTAPIKKASSKDGVFSYGQTGQDLGPVRPEAGSMAELGERYGFYEPGETPARTVQVPKMTGPGQRVSQTARTILEAGSTPEGMVSTIEELIASGAVSHEVYGDEQAKADADQSIRNKGWDKTMEDWLSDVRRGIVSKKNTAVGWMLYNNAANSGNTEQALHILDVIIGHQRNAAQALQAARILKTLTPETRLYGIARSVKSLQQELVEKYKDRAPELKISEELAEKFLNAKTDRERTDAMKDIYRDIGRQMPSNFADKFRAWRYLAMLGNPRTHVRNIAGNAGFTPMVLAKDLTAAGIEKAVSLASGGALKRSKSLSINRELLKAAWNDYDGELVSGNGKYSDGMNPNQYIEEGRVIFQPGKLTDNPVGRAVMKGVETARKAASRSLEAEDEWFSKPHYAFALAQYCAANGIAPEQVKSGEGMDEARAYAIKEAQKATYKDANQLSDLLGSIKFRNPNTLAKKAANAAVEGILPYRRTPANILARGVEYSPIGLLNGIKEAVYDVQKGTKTGAEAIDSIAAGLTGTGLMALGAFLGAQGLVRGRGGDDEEKREFEEMMGHQAYSLELPNGKSYTLDWLAPEALPFFVGVNLQETAANRSEGIQLKSLLAAVGTVTEPLLEMSCLQSLNDLFESVGYASSSGTSALTSILTSAATSYLTQAVPTLLGQIERTGETERMTTYTEAGSFLTDDAQYFLGKTSGRIPGLDYNQIPYIDAWGRRESGGGLAERAFGNFANPAYSSEIETSPMEQTLLELYNATGESAVFPDRARKYFHVNGERIDLTGAQYVQYAEAKGQTSYDLLTKLTENAAFKQLDSLDQVDVIQRVYDYADALAKMEVSDYEPDGWVSTAAKVCEHAKIDPAVYFLTAQKTDGITGLKGADGNTAAGSKSLQIMDQIYRTGGLTDPQRKALFSAFGVGTSVINLSKEEVTAKLAEIEAGLGSGGASGSSLEQEIRSAFGVSEAEYWYDKAAYDTAYSYATSYDRQMLKTAEIAVGMEDFVDYAQELSKFQSDKDASGKSINNSLKKKIRAYCEGLEDPDIGKLLFKMRYPKDDTYNRDIVYYLIGRDDISRDQTITVLEELGFTVDKNGYVTWD